MPLSEPPKPAATPSQTEGNGLSRQRGNVSEATLKTRIATQLARLEKLVPDTGARVDPRLASWPGKMDRLVDDLVLLRAYDPLDALRGLRALDCRIIVLESCDEGDNGDIGPILACQTQARGLTPDFHAALAQGDPDTLVEQVFTLLVEPDLLDVDEDFPQPLLDALGRDGREAVVRRLVDAHGPGSSTSSGSKLGCDWSWSVTELLLAEPDVEHALAMIDCLGLRDQVGPTAVVRFLLRHGALGGEFMVWMRRSLNRVGSLRGAGEESEEEEALRRPDREGVAVCEAQGLADLAQKIRHASFEILLDTEQLRNWLQRLPAKRQALEKARALRHVAAHPDRFRALMVLLEWPNLEAAVRLVMEHHNEMDRQSCTTFNKVARQLEATAPRAAMLLYRRGALCQFSVLMDWADSGPRLARCAELWDRHPDGSYVSHAEFMDQLKQEKALSW